MSLTIKKVVGSERPVDLNDVTKGYFVRAVIDPDGEFIHEYQEPEVNPETGETVMVTKQKTDFCEEQEFFIPHNDPSNTEAKVLSRAAWNHWNGLQALVNGEPEPAQVLQEVPLIPEEQL